MTFFLMGNFKICRCNQCHKYYIYSGEKHSSCCSEIYYQYKPATYKYWNKQIEKVKGAIRKQMDSSDKAGKDEIDGISEFHPLITRDDVERIEQEIQEYTFGSEILKINTDNIESDFYSLCDQVINFII